MSNDIFNFDKKQKSDFTGDILENGSGATISSKEPEEKKAEKKASLEYQNYRDAIETWPELLEQEKKLQNDKQNLEQQIQDFEKDARKDMENRKSALRNRTNEEIQKRTDAWASKEQQIKKEQSKLNSDETELLQEGGKYDAWKEELPTWCETAIQPDSSITEFVKSFSEANILSIRQKECLKEPVETFAQTHGIHTTEQMKAHMVNFVKGDTFRQLLLEKVSEEYLSAFYKKVTLITMAVALVCTILSGVGVPIIGILPALCVSLAIAAIVGVIVSMFASGKVGVVIGIIVAIILAIALPRTIIAFSRELAKEQPAALIVWAGISAAVTGVVERIILKMDGIKEKFRNAQFLKDRMDKAALAGASEEENAAIYCFLRCDEMNHYLNAEARAEREKMINKGLQDVDAALQVIQRKKDDLEAKRRQLDSEKAELNIRNAKTKAQLEQDLQKVVFPYERLSGLKRELDGCLEELDGCRQRIQQSRNALSNWKDSPVLGVDSTEFSPYICIEREEGRPVIMHHEMKPIVMYYKDNREESNDPAVVLLEALYRLIYGFYKISPRELQKITLINPVTGAGSLLRNPKFRVFHPKKGMDTGEGTDFVQKESNSSLRILSVQKDIDELDREIERQSDAINKAIDDNEERLREYGYGITQINRLRLQENNAGVKPFPYQILIFIVPRDGDRKGIYIPDTILEAIQSGEESCGFYGLLPIFLVNNDSIYDNAWKTLVETCARNAEVYMLDPDPLDIVHRTN